MTSREHRHKPSANLVRELTDLVARAARAILKFDPREVGTRRKEDASPLTDADEAADAVLGEGLARLLPGLPIVSEEGPRPAGALGSEFILVDPIDGTREFLAGSAEYTVNVAVIVEGRPALGVVAAPALGLLWRGARGASAERLTFASDEGQGGAERIRSRSRADGLVALVSRSHLDARSEALLDRLPVAERLACGSSLKFCRIAEAGADLYPRLAPTSEWDIAAGDAVLTAAGGVVLGLDGAPLRYGDAAGNFRVAGFVAWGDSDAAKQYGG